MSAIIVVLEDDTATLGLMRQFGIEYYGPIKGNVSGTRIVDKNRQKNIIKFYEKVMEKYPEKSKRIEEELKKLSELENKGEENIDLTSGCFGRIMSELFLYKIDEWTEYLDKMGFFLGKYIYILDAFCDYDKDMEKGRFNALKGIGKDQDKIKNMLTLMMSECLV